MKKDDVQGGRGSGVGGRCHMDSSLLELETLLSKREEPRREKAFFTQQKLQGKAKPKLYVFSQLKVIEQQISIHSN